MIPDYTDFYKKNVLINSSAFAIKKPAFRAVGGFTEGEFMTEDGYFYLKVLRKFALAYLNVPPVYYNREIDTQVSSQIMDLS